MRRPPASETAKLPATFAVIGQDRADPDRLLLLGDDSRYFGLRLPDGPAVAVEPDETAWALDLGPPTAEDLFA